jgi:hypothetical protein
VISVCVGERRKALEKIIVCVSSGMHKCEAAAFEILKLKTLYLHMPT